MNIIIIILIFVTVLFIYLHVFFHLKTSNDLELYEFNNISKERLEEICDLRQPIKFDFDTDKFKNLSRENILKNYKSFDIKLRDTSLDNSKSELYLPITLENGVNVLVQDKKNKFISENNNDFLEETSLIKSFKTNDEFFRPNMLAKQDYDLIMGAKNSSTPLKYNNNYRTYFMVIKGRVKIKLTPPKNNKYIHPVNDYDNYEFRSPLNIWNIQDEFKTDFNKIKCLEITLEPGKAFFIPAYWWYTIKFDDYHTNVISMKYTTYMNMVAIFPSIFISFLQQQNIKHNVVENLTDIKADDEIKENNIVENNIVENNIVENNIVKNKYI